MQMIMIVEDNDVTREGMCENINWKEHDIDLIAALQNGMEAIELLQTRVPDVIVTDIVMPMMDGLELARKVKKDYPDIKIIVLSAYDEFEYAQEAIKLGVFDYIMKPFDYKYLLDTVKSALHEKKHDSILKEQVKKSIPILREKFLKQLVEEDRDDFVFMDDAKYLDLSFKNTHYICILYNIDNIKLIKKKMRMEQFNIQLLKITDFIYSNLMYSNNWVFQIKNNCLASIIGFNEEEVHDFYNKINERLENLRKEVEKKCGLTLTIGVGSITSPISNIEYSYHKALKVLEYKFLMGNNRIFYAKDVESTTKSQQIHFPLSIEERFIKKVCLGNMNEAMECIRELAEYFNNNTVDKDYVKTIVAGLVSKMFQTLYEWGIKTDKISMSRANMYKQIEDFDESKQMFSWLENLVIKICRQVEVCMDQKHQQIIYEVIDFINKSYMNQDLSLNKIAKEVCLSPTYLSGIFKKESKTNISEYILKVRMEKAQELLRNTDLKIAAVSSQVGYSNQFYFSTCFKKIFGQTPNEFRSRRN